MTIRNGRSGPSSDPGVSTPPRVFYEQGDRLRYPLRETTRCAPRPDRVVNAPLLPGGDGMWKSVLAVSLGAALGALLRWQFSERWNGILPAMPLGTLAANLLGGYLAGVAIGYFAATPAIPPEWRLLILTGFCGGLTTFSTFSIEVMALLQAGRIGWAGGLIATHVAASVVAAWLGVSTMHLLVSGSR